MLDSLYIASTGLRTSGAALNSISENVANLNTVAFKREKVSFQDLMYQVADGQTASLDGSNTRSAGAGSMISAINKDFSVGEMKTTQNPLDVAINGHGLIEVLLSNGEYGYTRSGSLQVNNDGYLTTSNGLLLSSMIQIPSDAVKVDIAEDGKVFATTHENERNEIGSIRIASFTNEAGLKAIGNGVYINQTASGPVSYATPGENGVGTLMQGFLEASNVNLVSELMDMVVAQQAFSMNSQVIKASSQMQEIVANLRQG